MSDIRNYTNCLDRPIPSEIYTYEGGKEGGGKEGGRIPTSSLETSLSAASVNGLKSNIE